MRNVHIQNVRRKEKVLSICLTMIFVFLISSCEKQQQNTTANKPFVTTELSKTPSSKQTPWELPTPPPKSVYDGPLFKVSHDYPKTAIAPPNPAPWRVAIKNKEINKDNADAYVEALKNYIAKDMKTLLFDSAHWDGDKAQWYVQPWLSNIREPIHGTYQGSAFGADMFPKSGLKTEMVTHVLVYYDKVAATSLQKVWGESGMTPIPGITSGGAQFPEGSIIVKPTFETADGNSWPPMQGAYPWKIWAEFNQSGSNPGKPELQTVHLFQFDIIVKDTQSAPKTGWVFATLVYDNRVKGEPWDKMIPLGAMWGNDPMVKSPQGCGEPPNAAKCPDLSETWINPKAPVYATETLGWGGRLSGPNDGAVDTAAAIQETDDKIKLYSGRYAMSSCMGCHIAAEYKMQSSLLPGPPNCIDALGVCVPSTVTCDAQGKCKLSPEDDGTNVLYYSSGSDNFIRWFQDLPGSTPLDKGSTALDYDMVYAFKSLKNWAAATQSAATPMLLRKYDRYNGININKK